MLPGVVSAQEPIPPVDPLVQQFVVDPSGPDGIPGVWVWSTEFPADLLSYQIGAKPSWHFVAADELPVSGILQKGQPAWPADPTKMQLVAGVYPATNLSGSWLWNPYAFVGGDSGPVFWVPSWVFLPGKVVSNLP
jgi:hypothetical protein